MPPPLSQHLHLPSPALRVRRAGALSALLLGLMGLMGLANDAAAMGLKMVQQAEVCAPSASTALALQTLPREAANRIPDSRVTSGQLDVAWAWLGSPTLRYPHRALGSPTQAGSVHAVVKARTGVWQAVELRLPLHRVYEDRLVRIVDIDRDGSEELLLIEADALRGASLVVLGVDHEAGAPRLVERARSAFAGTPFRWLNPVGVADFDADGRLDLAMVRTPHIGGELQLLHYRPPSLVVYARALDVSNHRMGDVEQDLAVIVQVAGQRPTVVVPDMTLRALHLLRWDAPGQWTELGDVRPLPGRIERLSAVPGGACALLDDGRSMRVMVTP